MNTKIIIDGLKNSQKFRAIINGVVIGDCQVKDLLGNRFMQREQRVAVWNALMKIGTSRRINLGCCTSFAGRDQGVDIQVDLI